jgi:hypothetical protein
MSGSLNGIDRGERVRVLLTWLVVAIPALRGVAQVVQRAMALFRHP